MANDFVLAADIGGTHITAALIDMAHRQLVPPSLMRRHVDANGSAEAVIEDWSACLLSALNGADASKICLAMPGPFNYETGVSLMSGQGKYDSLYNKNVKFLLAESLGLTAEKIFAENDAACFLQGEIFAGCADGYQKAIGITLGTGLGTAIHKNGRSRNADLWCFPFLDSIAEDYLATRWFIRRYQELSGNVVQGVKEIAQQATTETAAQIVFKEFGKNLAEFLQWFIEQEEPEVVVIAGNISNAFDLFRNELEEMLNKHFPSVQLKKSVLGEQSTLLGAAGSWYSISKETLTAS